MTTAKKKRMNVALMRSTVLWLGVFCSLFLYTFVAWWLRWSYNCIKILWVTKSITFKFSFEEFLNRFLLQIVPKVWVLFLLWHPTPQRKLFSINGGWHPVYMCVCVCLSGPDIVPWHWGLPLAFDGVLTKASDVCSGVEQNCSIWMSRVCVVYPCRTNMELRGKLAHSQAVSSIAFLLPPV